MGRYSRWSRVQRRVHGCIPRCRPGDHTHSGRNKGRGIASNSVKMKPQLPQPLAPMPEKPTLADFFNLRFQEAQHVMQSAARALRNGLPEEIVFACLLHDTGMALQMPDHGYVGAALYEPYVDEKVSWAIRYHQALRFFPDPDVGYEYPEIYYELFGKDFVPEPYIRRDYEYAKKHKWYMAARLVTLNDEYSFDKSITL